MFPDHLAKEGREEIIEVLNELSCDYIMLSENDTKFGVVYYKAEDRPWEKYFL